MLRLTISILCMVLAGMMTAQHAVSKQIETYKAEGVRFTPASPLKLISLDIKDRSGQLEGITQAALFQLNEESVRELVENQPDFIEMALPVDERTSVTLQLVRHEIFTEDFALFISSEPGIPVPFRSGVHYKGAVKGQAESVVALSVFDNEIMGLVSTSKGNLVLGRIQHDREDTHILYHDNQLTRLPAFDCATPDDGASYTVQDLEAQPGTRDAGDCVRVYIEIDDDIVTQKGGGVPATNYITGLFNQSIILYNNDQVNMAISEIIAWTTPAPYSGSSSSAMLQSFQANTGAFNGNVGHLVSYQASGGIAVLDNVCSTNPDWRKCFSSISSTYQNVPTYSWSVMVITHEMGHVIGSKHTHACVWNGNNTAIDGCAGATEGGCPVPPIPQGGGTIMSYCHLQNVGINFNLGFGPQPGNVIRNRVNAANNCLTPCGPPPPPPPPPPPSYCSANGSISTYEWIQKVVLGSINNTSGNNGGYFDYTAQSTNLTAGTAYTAALTPGYAGSNFTEYWRIWIDYNNDLDFVDAGEQVAQGSGVGLKNLSFTVPAGTPTGAKRMRIAMKYAGYAAACGTFSYGEVEDYTVNITASGGGGATCSDGIQNQGETGIDCGGPCPACPTCNDGIQNQGETGIDCGGPCAPCGGGGSNVLLASYFETGWDSWVDNGYDATRVNSVNSWEGSYSIRLSDNSGTNSAMTSPGFNLSDATGLQMTFYFKAIGVEVGEDFWIQYKNGSGAWTTIGQLIRGTHFNNNTFYLVTVNVPNFTPTASGTLRIQCDASDDTDLIYIDQVTITKLTGGALPEGVMVIKEYNETPGAEIASRPDVEMAHAPVVFPNPAIDMLHIRFEGEIQGLRLVSMEGVEMRIHNQSMEDKQLDIHHLAPGLYVVLVQSENQWYPVRFNKM